MSSAIVAFRLLAWFFLAFFPSVILSFNSVYSARSMGEVLKRVNILFCAMLAVVPLSEIIFFSL